jgi:hypothetical protein
VKITGNHATITVWNYFQFDFKDIYFTLVIFVVGLYLKLVTDIKCPEDAAGSLRVTE